MKPGSQFSILACLKAAKCRLLPSRIPERASGYDVINYSYQVTN